MKTLGLVLFLYVAVVGGYLVWSLARAMWVSYRAQRHLNKTAANARHYRDMCEQLRREHREKELIPAGEIDYREFGED